MHFCSCAADKMQIFSM